MKIHSSMGWFDVLIFGKTASKTDICMRYIQVKTHAIVGLLVCWKRGGRVPVCLRSNSIQENLRTQPQNPHLPVEEVARKLEEKNATSEPRRWMNSPARGCYRMQYHGFPSDRGAENGGGGKPTMLPTSKNFMWYRRPAQSFVIDHVFKKAAGRRAGSR